MPLAPRIPSTDISLTWFFCEGQSAFERSPSGAILERAEQFAFDSTGRHIPSERVQRLKAWEFHGKKTAAHSIAPIYMSPEDAAALRSLIDWDELDPSITARPKQAARRQDSSNIGYEPDHHSLMLYAAISRRLNRLPLSQQGILAAYYGLEGARWESHSGTRMGGISLGRLQALYPLTKPGQKLLSMHASAVGTPTERLAQIASMHRLSAIESALLKLCADEAAGLLKSARDAYVATSNVEREAA